MGEAGALVCHSPQHSLLYTLIIGVICLFSFEFVMLILTETLKEERAHLKEEKGKGRPTGIKQIGISGYLLLPLLLYS